MSLNDSVLLPPAAPRPEVPAATPTPPPAITLLPPVAPTAAPGPTPSGVRFTPPLAEPFCRKSVSPATRRAYRLALTQFFAFVNHLHPTALQPAHIAAWRDHLTAQRHRPATVAFKLAVLRSFLEYLKAAGELPRNVAATRLVSPPAVPEATAGRALTPAQVRYLLAGPDRTSVAGARDYALLLLMLRLGLRVSEVCALRGTALSRCAGRWVLTCRVKGGRERVLPLPEVVKQALDAYLQLDAARRVLLHTDAAEAFLFQPLTNYRTLVFDKGLSVRQAWNLVQKWALYAGLGRLSPHDLRRTAITQALEQGLSYRQVQMMSGHHDPKTVMRYDHGRANLAQNAVNFLSFDED